MWYSLRGHPTKCLVKIIPTADQEQLGKFGNVLSVFDLTIACKIAASRIRAQ